MSLDKTREELGDTLTTLIVVFQDIQQELRQVSLRRGLSPSYTDDAIQEVALACLEHQRVYPYAIAKRLVFAILRNTIVGMFRKARVRARAPRACYARGLVAPPADEKPARDDLIAKLINKLTSMEQTALFHRFWQDRSFSQIGHLLGCSEATARQTCWRTITKLMRELNK